MAAKRGRPLTGEEKKVATRLWLEPSVLEGAKREARALGVTASEWVNSLLKRTLARRRRK